MMILLTIPLVMGAVPQSLDVNGIVYDTDGNVINGTANFTLSLYNTATGGSAAFEQSFTDLAVSRGFFATVFDGIDESYLINNSDTYVGVTVNDDSEASPRINITSVPYSLNAGNAYWDKFGNDITYTDGNVAIGNNKANVTGLLIDGSLEVTGNYKGDGSLLTGILTSIDLSNYLTNNESDTFFELVSGNNNFSSTNVGIGTGEPLSELHISSSTASAIRLADTSDTTTLGALLFYGGSTLRAEIQGRNDATTGSTIYWRLDDAEKMRLTSAGNLGIGITTPQAVLNVHNTSAISVPYLNISDSGFDHFRVEQSGDTFIGNSLNVTQNITLETGSIELNNTRRICLDGSACTMFICANATTIIINNNDTTVDC